MATLEYKCPACGGTLAFDVKEQKLKCEYCDSVFDKETVEEYNEAIKLEEEASEYSWTEYGEGSEDANWSEEEMKTMKVYTCPACGAEIMADDTTTATKCVYCDNNTILEDKMTGCFKPDYVIPFKVTKEEAIESLKNFYKGKRLLPKCFTEENKIKEITGIYVPFWLYDSDATANITFNATRVRHWSDSRYNYTETKHYCLVREGSLSFKNVPADGSSKADDATMDSIEPYDVSALEEFDSTYLSGYLADKYDVTSSDNLERVNKRIENSTIDAFRDTCEGYTSVTVKNPNIKLGSNNIRYVMMPVWMLNTKYKDKIYTFALNGQTGKVAGKLPVSKEKVWGYLLGITAVITVLGTFISGLL